MAELNKVRVQVLDPSTGAVLDNVDVKTSDGAVYLPDGTTLRDWINNSETAHSEFQQKLAAHLATKHVDAAKVDQMLAGVTYTETDGKLTFTKHDGTEQVIDTALEKLAVNFTMVDGTDDEEGQKFLVLTLDDGSEMRVNVTDLVDIYTGSTGTNVVVTVNSQGEIGATLVANSIGMDALTQEVVNAINAAYVLPAATADTLGGIKVGTNLSVEADGTLSAVVPAATADAIGGVKPGANMAVDAEGAITAANVKLGDQAANLVFVESTENVELAVTSTAETIITTTAGVTVQPITVNATKTGASSEAASLAYQWFKKVVGTDVAFSAIDGANTTSLATANINVEAAGTTVYYCRVSAIGEGVVANPVASKQFTVIVSAAA